MEQIRQLMEENEKLREQLKMDCFLPVYNKNYLQEQYSIRKHKNDLAIILADLDHFKKINDIYGHTAGDIVLRSFVEIVKACIRTTDIAGRYGGEEFLVLCLSSSIAEAYRIAERIRRRLEITDILLDDQTGYTEVRVTASFGVGKTIEEADKALYHAKRSGKNRTKIFEYWKFEQKKEVKQ